MEMIDSTLGCSGPSEQMWAGSDHPGNACLRVGACARLGVAVAAGSSSLDCSEKEAHGGPVRGRPSRSTSRRGCR